MNLITLHIYLSHTPASVQTNIIFLLNQPLNPTVTWRKNTVRQLQGGQNVILKCFVFHRSKDSLTLILMMLSCFNHDNYLRLIINVLFEGWKGIWINILFKLSNFSIYMYFKLIRVIREIYNYTRMQNALGRINHFNCNKILNYIYFIWYIRKAQTKKICRICLTHETFSQSFNPNMVKN